MDTAKQAGEILSEAERQMRELVGEAASAGDYEVAVQVTEWAKALGDLARSAQEKPRGGSAHVTVESGTAAVLRRTRRTRPAKKTARRLARARKKGEYPRFVRRNDSLVKIGWSKSERSEYQHTAPRRVVDLLASALSEKAANGKLVKADDVLPLADTEDGSEVPSYQAYLCLAWLRVQGLVRQQGRQGYLVPKPTSLRASLEQLWRQLPST